MHCSSATENVSVDETDDPRHVDRDDHQDSDHQDDDDVGDEKSLVDSFWEGVGRIDESRIVFPERRSDGDVTRLYSRLRYDERGSSHAPGSVWSAAALVAGTTIGAGVLALPAAAAPAGFVPSTAGLCYAWAYMAASGLAVAECAVHSAGETGAGHRVVGLTELYERYLPRSDDDDQTLRAISTAAYFLLHYAVMVAFAARGGAELETLVAVLPQGAGSVVFAGSLGALTCAVNKNDVDKVNGALVALVFASLMLTIAMLASGASGNHLSLAHLLDPAASHPDRVVDALPIFFLSLVYHNVVPTVVSDLEGDREKITKALLLGSAAPLCLFVLWNAVVLGVATTTTDGDPTAWLVDGAFAATHPLLSTSITVFSLSAIVTSAIGFVYGLVAELRTTLAFLPPFAKDQNNNHNNDDQTRTPPLLCAVAVVPPLVFAQLKPDIFLEALDLGGAFGVTVLFLILPPLMLWTVRYGDDGKGPLTTPPLVPGGKIALGSMWKVAGTLLLEQGADKLGLWRWLRETTTHLLAAVDAS